jgi:hypothetical protein
VIGGAAYQPKQGAAHEKGKEKNANANGAIEIKKKTIQHHKTQGIVPNVIKVSMYKMHGENTAQTFYIAWQHSILIHAIPEVFVHYEYGPTNRKEEERNKDGV